MSVWISRCKAGRGPPPHICSNGSAYVDTGVEDSRIKYVSIPLRVTTSGFGYDANLMLYDMRLRPVSLGFDLQCRYPESLQVLRCSLCNKVCLRDVVS